MTPAFRLALPDTAVLSVLPGHGDLLALTVDDGVSTDGSIRRAASTPKRRQTVNHSHRDRQR
jgi:hypothetical protein